MPACRLNQPEPQPNLPLSTRSISFPSTIRAPSRYANTERVEVKQAPMTITLHLKPQVEAGLLAQAHARGMSLEEYLLSLVEEATLQAVPSKTPLTGPQTRE
jgi:hypothetical protein